MKKTNCSNIRHYFNHLTCTLFVVLGLLGIFASASQAATGAFAFSTATYSVDEGAGKVSITVNRVGGSTGAASVSFRTNQITAVAGSDFVNIPLTTLNFAHRERQKVVSVNIINDTVVEPDETFEVLLSNPTYGTTLGKISSSVITIQDNDIAPVNSAVDTMAPTVSLTSPATSTTFTTAQTVTIAASASDNVGISKVELYEGTTLKGTDTTAPYSFAWTISNTNNGNHSFTAKAYDAAGNSKVSNATAVTVNIPTQEATNPGSFEFAASTYTVNENGGKVDVVIKRVGGSDGAVTVGFRTGLISAKNDLDYVGIPLVTQTFASGVTQKTISIGIIDDKVIEPTETFKVLLSDPTGGATLGAVTESIITILDDDTIATQTVANPGSFEFAVGAYTVSENDGKVDVIINRVGGSDGSVTVDFRTGLISAKNDTDYVGIPLKSLSFASGETWKIERVTIINDSIQESTETFKVILSNPTSGSTLGAVTESIITILDDDAATTQTPVISGPVRVFPGAEGFGTTTPAGRGGKIIKVTNLNDSGTGSLRAAITATGPRIVVFEVGGTIALQSKLYLNNPYITIAGQTAPFPGIQLKNAGIYIKTHDVLIQHLRIRPGDADPGIGLITERHALAVQAGSYNVVIDHNTFQWATDENAAIWSNTTPIRDITFSNNLIPECLVNGSYGMAIGTMLNGVQPDFIGNISVIGNLFAHNTERQPKIGGNVRAVVANNVSYNGQYGFVVVGASSGPSSASFYANHYITGQANNGSSAISVSADAKGSKVYLASGLYQNMVTGTRTISLYSDYAGGSTVTTPPVVDSSITLMPVSDTRNHVLGAAGAWPAFRDSAEKRVLVDVSSEIGFLKNTLNDAGGWPSDYDKSTYRALTLPANPNADDDGNGYTNIEEFLYQLARNVEGR